MVGQGPETELGRAAAAAAAAAVAVTAAATAATATAAASTASASTNIINSTPPKPSSVVSELERLAIIQTQMQIQVGEPLFSLM